MWPRPVARQICGNSRPDLNAATCERATGPFGCSIDTCNARVTALPRVGYLSGAGRQHWHACMLQHRAACAMHAGFAGTPVHEERGGGTRDSGERTGLPVSLPAAQQWRQGCGKEGCGGRCHGGPVPASGQHGGIATGLRPYACVHTAARGRATFANELRHDVHTLKPPLQGGGAHGGMCAACNAAHAHCTLTWFMQLSLQSSAGVCEIS